jgi:hypothetical protein
MAARARARAALVIPRSLAVQRALDEPKQARPRSEELSAREPMRNPLLPSTLHLRYARDVHPHALIYAS